MSLRDLAAKTPPGPWRVIPEVKRQGMFAGTDPFVRAADDKTVATGIRSGECGALISLAPELAVLCDKASRWIDMVLAQGAILEGDAALGDEIVKAVLELEARP